MRLAIFILAAISSSVHAAALVPPRHDLASLFAAVDASFVAETQLRAAAAPALRGRWLTVRATAYSPHDSLDGSYHATKGERWRWITADGQTDVRKQPYGIAVPRLTAGRPAWPYGTRVLIPTGQGYLDQSRPDERLFTVDDTGGAIRGKTERSGVLHIDLRFRTESSARAFGGDAGWRELRVMVLE
jgi:3D (Asp-Asp-Asp) domain-containing protein